LSAAGFDNVRNLMPARAGECSALGPGSASPAVLMVCAVKGHKTGKLSGKACGFRTAGV